MEGHFSILVYFRTVWPWLGEPTYSNPSKWITENSPVRHLIYIDAILQDKYHIKKKSHYFQFYLPGVLIGYFGIYY